MTQKNVASQKIALFAFDTTTGVPKTGDAANLTAYVSKDWGSVTVLGDTSATEMDATNAKGWYLFDLTQAETNADALLFTGKSTTANVSVVGQSIYTLPASFTAFTAPLDAAGTRSAVGLASANLDTQLTAIDDFIDTEVAAILAAVDTEVAAIKTKTDFLPSATAGAAGGVFIAGTNAATVVTTSFTTTFTGNMTGSVASVTGAVGSVTGLTASNLDATISSRLASASYTAPDNAGITTISGKVAGLTYTVANTLDANIQRVNDVLVNGIGTVGSPWGP